MAALVLYPKGLPVIEDFDPREEKQADVEARHRVDFSDYFETREKAEQAVRSKSGTDSYSGFGSLGSYLGLARAFSLAVAVSLLASWVSEQSAGAQGAVTSYVAPNGNDSNPGTISQPYLTIQRCATAVPAGSTCVVRAGTYYETVTPNSGVTVISYTGESVTVDGTEPVTGWTLYRGLIYAASVMLPLADANQVFAGDQMMTEARWPNGNELFNVNWATAQAGTTTSLLVDPTLPDINWTGAKIHFLSGPDPYAPQTGTITGSAPGQLNFALDGPVYLPDIQPQPGGLYFLYRSLGALDAQEEWFYDSAAQTLYFRAPGDVNANTLLVRAKRRLYAFDLSGRSNVTIQNINLFACTINMDASSTNNTLDGINARYLSHYTDLPAESAGYPTSYWYEHNTDSGIILNGSGNVLENSTIAWSAGNGVSLMGNSNTVKNNLVYNTGYVGNDATGVSLFGTGHAIQYNTIHTNGRYSVTIYSYPVNPNNNDVSYNNLYNAMMLGPDGGEFYTGEAAVTGTRIHHNWLHDTQPLPAPAAVFNTPTRNGLNLDAGSNGFEADQNVLWNNVNGSIVVNGGQESVVDASPNNNNVHNNTIPDISSGANIEVNNILNCGTTQAVDNLVLVPVQQYNAACPVSNNGATAPGATDMNSSVQVGCNFSGCATNGPPAISGTSVGASIASQPVSVTALAGQTATFTVVGAGSPTLQYQWQKNGQPVSQAKSASYTTPATALTNSGASFAVYVSNSVGGALSDAAILTVLPNPCDIGQTGSVNISDVQLVVNEALGTASAVNDLDGDGLVNVVDVQIEISGALGSCIVN
jgi:hypothetical protein